MEDKTFDLLTKMYSEINNRFDDLKDRFDNLENRLDKLEVEVKHNSGHILRLENKLDEKTEVLFDGYKQVYEKLEEHDTRFDLIDSKLENQNIEMRVLKGGK